MLLKWIPKEEKLLQWNQTGETPDLNILKTRSVALTECSVMTVFMFYFAAIYGHIREIYTLW